MTLWLTLLGMGLVTYAIRLVPIITLEHLPIPLRVRQALRFVPPAVLSAIVFPEVFRPNAELDISFGNVRLIAGLLAALIAWRTKNVLWTIGVGMAVVWGLQALK